jgi:hypothetical protein
MRQEAWCPNARCWPEATPVRAGGLQAFAAVGINGRYGLGSTMIKSERFTPNTFLKVSLAQPSKIF